MRRDGGDVRGEALDARGVVKGWKGSEVYAIGESGGARRLLSCIGVHGCRLTSLRASLVGDVELW